MPTVHLRRGAETSGAHPGGGTDGSPGIRRRRGGRTCPRSVEPTFIAKKWGISTITEIDGSRSSREPNPKSSSR